MRNTSYKPTSLLPKVYPIEEHALDIATSVRIDGISLELQRIKTLANPKECPVDFLPILAYSFGSDFYWKFKDLDEKQQREMIANSLLLHRKKGTLWAIKKVLDILGFETEITEWWEDKEDPFGINPTKPYTFSIVLDITKFYQNSKRVFNEYEQIRVLKYLHIYKNVRSHFYFYIKASCENRVSLLSSVKVAEIENRNAVSKDYKKDSDVAVSLVSSIEISEIENKSAVSEQYRKDSDADVAVALNLSTFESVVRFGEIKRPVVAFLKPIIVATFKIQEVNRCQSL